MAVASPRLPFLAQRLPMFQAVPLGRLGANNDEVAKHDPAGLTVSGAKWLVEQMAPWPSAPTPRA